MNCKDFIFLFVQLDLVDGLGLDQKATEETFRFISELVKQQQQQQQQQLNHSTSMPAMPSLEPVDEVKREFSPFERVGKNVKPKKFYIFNSGRNPNWHQQTKWFGDEHQQSGWGDLWRRMCNWNWRGRDEPEGRRQEEEDAGAPSHAAPVPTLQLHHAHHSLIDLCVSILIIIVEQLPLRHIGLCQLTPQFRFPCEFSDCVAQVNQYRLKQNKSFNRLWMITRNLVFFL